MKVIVDANILFSALRSSNRIFRRQLYFSECTFFAPKFLIVEIFEHKERILEKSKATPTEVYEYLDNVLQKITFVSNDYISIANYVEAYRLCKDVDEDDTPFVALALEMQAFFWTRDEKLKNHLYRMGFSHFFEPT
ncbi:PIN domain-containing protein [Runella sp. MFBS21]|uniref:PIN domain-containing protein n=1 Tax=Runella sp. MFBS21 TaxID=3034018 RepID=UPI0023F8E8AB|nr:PIN domain-containing protein [Runella sp. MFBS21]MDF7819648.1 PIN domain-containing protein [Runella sp. MFBS21]